MFEIVYYSIWLMETMYHYYIFTKTDIIIHDFMQRLQDVKNPLHRKSAFFFVARLVLYVFVWKKKKHVEKCLCEWMEKYCGSRYKFHFRKNRRRKRAAFSARWILVRLFSLARANVKAQEFKVGQSFARFWVKKKKKMTLFALTTKVVEEFSDSRSWIHWRSGGRQNDGNWGSSRIEFAKFRGPVLNGIACFYCPARSIYR